MAVRSDCCQFTSALLERISSRLELKIFPTAYHPQTNGQVERMNQYVAAALSAYVQANQMGRIPRVNRICLPNERRRCHRKHAVLPGPRPRCTLSHPSDRRFGVSHTRGCHAVRNRPHQEDSGSVSVGQRASETCRRDEEKVL